MSIHLCHITYPYPDDSRCWPSRSGRHSWRLAGRGDLYAVRCRHCGLAHIDGEGHALPWWLRLVLRIRGDER